MYLDRRHLRLFYRFFSGAARSVGSPFGRSRSPVPNNNNNTVGVYGAVVYTTVAIAMMRVRAFSSLVNAHSVLDICRQPSDYAAVSLHVGCCQLYPPSPFIIRPHRMHVVHSRNLLLQMCRLCVCWSQPLAELKR